MFGEMTQNFNRVTENSLTGKVRKLKKIGIVSIMNNCKLAPPLSQF